MEGSCANAFRDGLIKIIADTRKSPEMWFENPREARLLQGVMNIPAKGRVRGLINIDSQKSDRLLDTKEMQQRAEMIQAALTKVLQLQERVSRL